MMKLVSKMMLSAAVAAFLGAGAPAFAEDAAPPTVSDVLAQAGAAQVTVTGVVKATEDTVQLVTSKETYELRGPKELSQHDGRTVTVTGTVSDAPGGAKRLTVARFDAKKP